MTVINKHPSKTPDHLRDSWQTPQWLFNWINEKFNFDVDLAANYDNCKVDLYLDETDDALNRGWLQYGQTGWLNPPYSKIKPWLEKAWIEAQKGFVTVALIPTPNGESHYGDYVFGKASEIIFINGRIGFEMPNGDGTAKPVNGNSRGSCLVIYNRRYEGQTIMSWVDRDEMKELSDRVEM